jgi:hypothetical protein
MNQRFFLYFICALSRIFLNNKKKDNPIQYRYDRLFYRCEGDLLIFFFPPPNPKGGYSFMLASKSLQQRCLFCFLVRLRV